MKNRSYPNLLVVLTALLMLALPRSGRAQFNFITNADNTITITGYAGPGGNVTIPGITNNYSVTAIGTNAFEYLSTLRSVTIPGSVTSIGNDAFAYCSGLTNINVDTANPSYTSAGGVLFNKTMTTLVEYPGGLAGSYAIPNGVTSIDDDAFGGCSGLESVTIPDGLSSIGGGAFAVCSGLTDVTISGSVTSIGTNVFFGCSSLTNIDVDSANPNYASAGGVLFNKSLTTLVEYPGGLAGSYAIPNSATSIGFGAFGQCSRLTSVTIPNSVTSIGGGAFFACSGLTSVTIGNSVANIGDLAFILCSGLTSVTIPNSVTNIGGGAFQQCSGLHQAYFQGNAPSVDGVPGSGDTTVFSFDGTGTVYYVPGTTGWGATFGAWPTAVWSSPATDFTYTTNNDAITITGYTGPGGIVIIPGTINTYSVTAIGTNAFYANDTVTNVTIPNSVTSLGDRAFGNCSGLTSVAIGNGVTSIGNAAFLNCSGLTSVTIPNSVTNIGNVAFIGCSGLTSVTIPGSVTTISGSPFAACFGLTNIDVAGTNPNYASAGGVLFNKTLTTLLEFPPGLVGSYVIPNSVTTIGDYAFEGCSGLTSVTIPDSVTSIGVWALAVCSGLTSVTIPNSVTSVGPYAFTECTGLHEAFFQGNAPSVNGGAGSADTTVFQGDTGTAYYVQGTTGWGATFGGWPTAVWSSPATDFTFITNNDAITITGYTGSGGIVIIPGTINTYSVTAIGTNAFYNQTTLTAVTIPDSVTSIGGVAFGGCSGLTSVTIPNSVTSIGVAAFESCSGLTRVAIPDSVTSIDDAAFIGCSGLTSVTIGNSVTSIGVAAFVLTGLTNVTIPNSVTSIGTNAFDQCYSLANVAIPDSVTNIGEGPFAYCSSLTNIGVEVANPSYASVGGVLFDKTLTTLSQYPGGLAGSYAIPESVTSIGGQAFAGCSGLTTVTIDNGVTDIGQYAFSSCTNLHQAFFKGNAPTVNGGAGSADSTVFNAGYLLPPTDEWGSVYYVPGTTGWGDTFGGWPTAGWYQPRPQILGSGYGLGVGSQGFQFTISWATNAAVVVEASTNLQTWTPVSTNTLVNGTSLFWDSDWTHYPQRFYRLRSR